MEGMRAKLPCVLTEAASHSNGVATDNRAKAERTEKSGTGRGIEEHQTCAGQESDRKLACG
jgi:hypothetical protein